MKKIKYAVISNMNVMTNLALQNLPNLVYVDFASFSSFTGRFDSSISAGLITEHVSTAPLMKVKTLKMNCVDQSQEHQLFYLDNNVFDLFPNLKVLHDQNNTKYQYPFLMKGKTAIIDEIRKNYNESNNGKQTADTIDSSDGSEKV